MHSRKKNYNKVTLPIHTSTLFGSATETKKKSQTNNNNTRRSQYNNTSGHKNHIFFPYSTLFNTTEQLPRAQALARSKRTAWKRKSISSSVTQQLVGADSKYWLRKSRQTAYWDTRLQFEIAATASTSTKWPYGSWRRWWLSAATRASSWHISTAYTLLFSADDGGGGATLKSNIYVCVFDERWQQIQSNNKNNNASAYVQV